MSNINDIVPTGSAALDGILGIGGLPKGRIVEIFGPLDTGKTALALSVVAQAQRAGDVAAYVDCEHALDLCYARDIGVNTSRMLLSQPDCGEQAMDVVEALVRSGQVQVVVVDSVAALTCSADSPDDGLHARLMSRAMRKLAALAHQTGTLLLFVNRTSSTHTPGGNALKFYASVRLELRRSAETGRVLANVVKNKLAPPFRQCELEIVQPGDGTP